MSTLFVCGLKSEARIAARDGAEIVLSGARPALLEARLAALAGAPPDLVVSFGLAAGLAAELPAGALLIADRVIDGAALWPTDSHLTARLGEALPGASIRPIAGVEAMLVDAADKAALAKRSGAAAADMESAAAAAFAARVGARLLVLRAVSDDAATTLPAFVRSAIGPEGGIRLAAMLGALARHPADIAALPRLARASATAHASLRTARAAMRTVFGV